VGEVKDGDVVHTSYFQGGHIRDGADSGLDSLLDFPLFYALRHAFAEGKKLDDVPKTLAKDYLYSNPDILVTLLGGHDDGRFMSEEGAAIAGLKLANVLVLTTRGVPQLYYGDELGMTGADEPTTRKDFPGGFPGDQRNAFTKEGRTDEEQELFEYIRKLTHLHLELQPLQSGKLVNLYSSEQQYAYARVTKRAAVVIVINNDSKPAQLEFDVVGTGLADGVLLTDRMDGSKAVVVTQGRLVVSLAGRSAAVLARN
jgi:glycosidase